MRKIVKNAVRRTRNPQKKALGGQMVNLFCGMLKRVQDIFQPARLALGAVIVCGLYSMAVSAATPTFTASCDIGCHNTAGVTGPRVNAAGSTSVINVANSLHFMGTSSAIWATVAAEIETVVLAASTTQPVTVKYGSSGNPITVNNLPIPSDPTSIQGSALTTMTQQSISGGSTNIGGGLSTNSFTYTPPATCATTSGSTQTVAVRGTGPFNATAAATPFTTNRTISITVDAIPTTAAYSTTIAYSTAATTINVSSAVSQVAAGGTITLGVLTGNGSVAATGATTFTYTASASAYSSTVSVPFTINGPCGGAAVTRTATITVNPPTGTPVFSNTNNLSAFQGTAITPFQLAASNMPTGIVTRVWSSTALPTGLSLSASTGQITGTPSVSGTFMVTMSANNGSATGNQSFTFNIGPPSPVFSPLTASPTGQTGVLFSYTPTVSNSPTSFSISAGTLPAGLNLNTSTGVISGTPSVTGSPSVTLSASNANPTPGAQTINFTITQGPPTITSGAPPAGQTGVPYTHTVTATNSTGITYSISAGALPAGLSLNGSTGVISGTPTAVGSSGFTITAANGALPNATQVTSINITLGPPAFTPLTATANGQTGVPFSYTPTVSNSPTTFSISAGTLPAWATLNTSTGQITGTPNATGMTVVTLQASNGLTGTQSLTFNITLGPPVVTSATTASGQTNFAITPYQITATNSPTSYSITAGTLPTGLSLNTGTGLISGTPTGVGMTTVTVGATNATNTGTQTLTFNVTLGVPIITSVATANGQTGVAFTYNTTALNTPTSYSLTGSLPTGLSFNTSTGVISGTPTVVVTTMSTVMITATNATGMSTALSLTINIAVSAPTVTSAGTASGTAGVAFSYTIVGDNLPSSYGLTGALPTGVTLNTTTGVISGTPTVLATATFNVMVTATNAVGTSPPRSLVITITLPAPTVTSALTASGTSGVAFSYTVTANNFPASFGLTGALPTGVTFNTVTGVLSGIPVVASNTTFNLMMSATNTSGADTKALTLTIAAPVPVITSPTTANGVVGVMLTYNTVSTNTNGTTAYSVTSGTLPAGLSINSMTGVISGTPTMVGVSAVTLTVNNGNTGSQVVTFTIIGAPVITSLATASGSTGTPFTYNITATNSPTSYSVTGALPAGLSVNTTTGVISGTPTASGMTTVTVNANNGATGSQSLTINIGLSAPSITSAVTAAGVVSTPFSYQIVGTNSPTSYGVTGALPAGVTLNTGTGLISGTPIVGGTFNVMVSATNATGSGSLAVAINIALVAPTITSPATATGIGGAPFTYQITASNQPASFNATGLPAGLTVNTTTGLISGASTVTGTFSVMISATNGAGTGSANLMLTLTLLAPVITSPTTATGAVPAPFTYQITADNFPVSFAATGLPPGLTVNTATGVISGTPSTFGTFNVMLSATNAAGTGTRASVITIANAPVPTVAARTLSVPFNTAASLNLASAITGLFTSIAVATPPTKGTLMVNGTTVIYTPNNNAFGADTFTYAATGIGGTSAPATVTVTIATPDAPTLTARDVSTPFNTPAVIDLRTYIAGVATSVSIVAQPSIGTLTLNGFVATYTPKKDSFGADLFSFTATGPGGTSASADVIVTVQTLAPTAAGTMMTVQLNTPASLDLAPFITGSAVSGIQIVTAPKHGSATVNGTVVTFTPVNNYFGKDTFTYRAYGNAGTSAPATVNVTVIGRPDPRNDTATTALLGAQADTAQRFSRSQLNNFQGRLDTLHMRSDPAATASADSGGKEGGKVAGAQSPAQPGDRTDGQSGTQQPLSISKEFDTAQRIIEGRLDTAIANANIKAGNTNAGNTNTGADSNKVGIHNPASAQTNDAFLKASVASNTNTVANPFPFSSELATVLSARSINIAALGSGADSGGAGGKVREDSTSVWLAGAANFGTRNAQGTAIGTDFSTSGVSVGFDRRLNKNWAIGIGLGYGRDRTAIGTDGSENRANGYSAVLYASYQPGASTFIDMLVGYGTIDNKSVRYVAPIDAFARASRTGNQMFGSVAFGYDYRNNGVTISPYARADYTSDRLNQTTETGADLYSLTYFRQTQNAVQGALGLRAESIHDLPFGRATPRLRLEYRHDFQGDRTASIAYADLADGPRYVLNTTAVARNTLVATMGIDLVRRDGLSLGLDYQIQRTFNKDRAQGIRLNISKDFDGRGSSFDLQNIFVAASKPVDMQVDAGLMFDSNVTRGKLAADKLSDRVYSVNVGKGIIFWLGDPRWRVLVNGSLGGESFATYTGLSRAMASLQSEVQFRTSSAFDAYTFAAFGQITGENYDSRNRDGHRYSIGVSVRQALTDRLSGFVAIQHNERHGKSAVFNNRDNAVRANIDYQWTPSDTLYVSGEYRKGSIVSSGHASLENINIAEVFALDDAYPSGQFFSYRFAGKTVISTVGYNMGLGTRHSLDLSWRRAQSTPDFRPSFATSPRTYVVDQYSLVYLIRF